MKVLVVEDEVSLCRSITQMLGKAGYETVEAYDGETALGMLSGLESVDLVVLDVNLPGINGLEVLKRVRSNARLADLPILICSGRSDSRTVILAARYKATDYIVKPFSLYKLRERVKTLIVKSVRTLADVSETIFRLSLNTSEYVKMLEKMKGDVSTVLDELEKLLRGAGSQYEPSSLHTLCTVATTLGAQRMARILNPMNKAMEAAELQQVRSLLPEARTELALLQEAVAELQQAHHSKGPALPQ